MGVGDAKVSKVTALIAVLLRMTFFVAGPTALSSRGSRSASVVVPLLVELSGLGSHARRRRNRTEDGRDLRGQVQKLHVLAGPAVHLQPHRQAMERKPHRHGDA